VVGLWFRPLYPWDKNPKDMDFKTSQHTFPNYLYLPSFFYRVLFIYLLLKRFLWLNIQWKLVQQYFQKKIVPTKLKHMLGNKHLLLQVVTCGKVHFSLKPRRIWGSHASYNEDSNLLGYYAADKRYLSPNNGGITFICTSTSTYHPHCRFQSKLTDACIRTQLQIIFYTPIY
jgi:hypothetical protein